MFNKYKDMKRDEELYKIQTIMTALNEFERRMYDLNLGDKASDRIRKYIAMRYKYLFDWINED